MAMHPPLFTEAGEPLEVDHWLRVMESKFGLLRCTATRPTDYQMSWAEFRDAFHAYYISAGVMRKKH
jgi:hypothetical protein